MDRLRCFPLVMIALLLGVSPHVCAQDSQAAPPAPAGATTATATFAGGCFWCMEPPFDRLDGVISTTSGFTGGRRADAIYERVSSGRTGHVEAVQIVYDPRKIDYAKLLLVFWYNIDPVATKGQFCDVGDQYRSAIFYHDEQQRQLAEASRRELEASGRFTQPITTEIVTAKRFYPADDEHQDYYLRNPVRYKFYHYRCGREQRLQEVWGKPASSPGAR